MLTGAGGCSGVARGRARVVLDPADPNGLEPGDVLVAPLTDPAWTPLFLPAAAVVVNVGALMSHAIIVSRELGIPCAVSVEGATERIPDGALIEVDGTVTSLAATMCTILVRVFSDCSPARVLSASHLRKCRMIEREIKLAADAGVVLPDLADSDRRPHGARRPRLVHLDAVYYDTPTLSLARWGVTLRSRTGEPGDMLDAQAARRNRWSRRLSRHE